MQDATRNTRHGIPRSASTSHGHYHHAYHAQMGAQASWLSDGLSADRTRGAGRPLTTCRNETLPIIRARCQTSDQGSLQPIYRCASRRHVKPSASASPCACHAVLPSLHAHDAVCLVFFAVCSRFTASPSLHVVPSLLGALQPLLACDQQQASLPLAFRLLQLHATPCCASLHEHHRGHCHCCLHRARTAIALITTPAQLRGRARHSDTVSLSPALHC